MFHDKIGIQELLDFVLLNGVWLIHWRNLLFDVPLIK